MNRDGRATPVRKLDFGASEGGWRGDHWDHRDLPWMGKSNTFVSDLLLVVWR